MIKFDGEKLNRVLKDRGVTLSEFSLSLKKDSSYISKAIRSNVINSTVYELMCLKLNLDTEYFSYIEPTPEVMPVVVPSTDEGCVVPIDYKTLKRLVACEYAVDAILKSTSISTGRDECLFIHYGATYGILRAYLPDDVEARWKELREVGNRYE